MPKPPSQRPEPVATNAFERASLPATRFIASLPPWAPVAAIFLLVLAGGLLGPWGALAWGLVSLFLLWMLALSWPRLGRSERIMRVAVIALIVALTVVKAIPR